MKIIPLAYDDEIYSFPLCLNAGDFLEERRLLRPHN